MNRYVIINGAGGVGKDEFVKKCGIFNENVVNMSTIEFVKKVALSCGWDGKKDDGNWADSGTYIYQLKIQGKDKLISGTIAFVK